MAKRGPKAVSNMISPGGQMVIDAPLEKPDVVERDTVASAEWDRLVAAMPKGFLTALEATIVTQYALAWSVLVSASLDIERYGHTLQEPVTANGKVVGSRFKLNPAFRTLGAANDVLLKAGARLGLSPGQRAKLRMPTNLTNSKWKGLIAR